MRPVEIYDNGGESVDRYTVIMDGSVYGMSENPLNPCGFNQYCGERSNYPEDMSHCGKPINYAQLPEPVRIAIAERQAGTFITTEETPEQMKVLNFALNKVYGTDKK